MNAVERPCRPAEHGVGGDFLRSLRKGKRKKKTASEKRRDQGVKKKSSEAASSRAWGKNTIP